MKLASETAAVYIASSFRLLRHVFFVRRLACFFHAFRQPSRAVWVPAFVTPQSIRLIVRGMTHYGCTRRLAVPRGEHSGHLKACEGMEVMPDDRADAGYRSRSSPRLPTTRPPIARPLLGPDRARDLVRASGTPVHIKPTGRMGVERG